MRKIMSVIIFTLLVLIAKSEVTPQQIDNILAGVVGRQKESLQRQLTNTWPTGDKHNFAFGAYGMNSNTAAADVAIVQYKASQYLADIARYHWTAYQQARLYWLYSSHSVFPATAGRMGMTAENAILDMMKQWAYNRLSISFTNPANIHLIRESENHHLQEVVSLWAVAHILADHPVHKTFKYADGSTPAQMAAAWDNYLKAWLLHRASNGLLVEVASPTYHKYSLNPIYDLADFATDPELKNLASQFLDIWWAEWAIEQIDGIRGGSRHRCYPGNYSEGASAGDSQSYTFLGIGSLGIHPGVSSIWTTFWRPSRTTIALAIDTPNRGSYSYISTPPGLNDLTPPSNTQQVPYSYALEPEGGNLLRYTWNTPDFIMGMSQNKALPESRWSKISSQNRWNGIIFGGHSKARIYTQRPDPITSDGSTSSGSCYNEEWGVQNKGVMILQHLTTKTGNNSNGQMIWFDASLTRQESNGWIFVEAPRAYAAVKPVGTGWSWKMMPVDNSSDLRGPWLVLNNKLAPIIMEVRRKQDYASFTAFKNEILGNPISTNGAKLDYTSRGYNTTLTHFTDESQDPRVDGVTINYNPNKPYNSPYLYGGGNQPVVISYGNQTTTYNLGSTANYLNPVNPSNTVNGLDYKYYHGTWNVLPNFDLLTPVKSGVVTNFNLSNATKADNFGFSFTGYINVPTDGVYTFYTTSDDGSKLFIGNREVVSNDAIQSATEKSGQIGLKAGKHAIRVEYFERAGQEVLQVSYAGPGISKRLIPNNALYRINTPPTTISKLIVTSDNTYELFLNGNLIGSGNNWKQTQIYTNLFLNNGKNVIAVKATDLGGIASFLSEMTINAQRIGTNSAWKVSLTAPSNWKNVDFDDNSWSNATVHGNYGVSPWGTNVANMPTDTPAKWIWSADANNHNTVYFRYIIQNESYENIALNKPTSQSSTYYGCEAKRAVDGNTNGIYGNNSLTHTNNDYQAWWKVDLGTNYSINRVRLWNRTDACGDRLSNFHVDYLNSSGTLIATINYPGTVGTYADINLFATGVRYVKVQLNGTNYLQLAEVQVYSESQSACTEISEEIIPKVVELSQNYPNPFNPKTTINFTLPEQSSVKLTVLNAKGETVKILANGNYQTGNHSLSFDGSGLNSGVYFYQLVTPEKTITKKMMLIK